MLYWQSAKFGEPKTVSRWMCQLLKRNRAGQSRIATTALLLAAFVLVVHSFEMCGSHLGIQTEPRPNEWVTVAHNGVQCSAQVGVACLCADCACVPYPLDSDSPHKDGCESTSELATRSQAVSFQLDAPLVVLPIFASLSDAIAVPAPLSAFLGGNGPPMARLRSQFLASPLSGRAPPISV